MVGAVQNLVRVTDAAIARLYLLFFHERHALLTVLFHSLFQNETEIAKNHVDPLDRTTVAQFRQLIEYYLAHDYRFISPSDLLRGLQPDVKYAMLTFDDGYYNNRLALPILEELRVPAVFFISTNHVRDGKCYWWDVIYRERLAEGASPEQVYGEALTLKSLRTEQIERQLLDRFGRGALTPRGDIDRPFTPDELRDFARSPCVHLGNHTADHAILTNYSHAEVRQQVGDAQRWLEGLTGNVPCAIAYPNGDYDRQVVEICQEAGLQVGFTIRPAKTKLPLQPDSRHMMRLGRFVPHSKSSIVTQCRTYRSDVLLYALVRGGYLRLARGRAED
jgi:peptidoglycan/xylan/chitin deacetylase (PgdA/CDA1 family)